MTEETKKLINRLQSENNFLKEVIKNNYKRALQALNFINSDNFAHSEPEILSEPTAEKRENFE